MFLLARPQADHFNPKTEVPDIIEDEAFSVQKVAQAGAPPNYFMVGQDEKGRWIVRDRLRQTGAIFCSFGAALRFAQEEADAASCSVVLSTSSIEIDLDM
jgi:hypothetical protein